DPQFFNPTAHGYIGKQIAAFATGSPLHNFLAQVAVPHATFFGILVSYGELAIGIGTILGLLFRPAAFFGLLISLMFFLSATWHVYPYFYGSDIVFVFCWLTLLLAGPLYTGLPALDVLLVQRVLSPQEQKTLAPLISFLLGVREVPQPAPLADVSSQGKNSPRAGNRRPAQQQSRYTLAQQTRNSRRNFLLGALTGGAGILGLTWLWNVLRLFPAGDASSGLQGGVNNATATPTSGATSNGTPAVAASPIAQANTVQNNSAVNFTIASNGDPGILVRLNDGKFVAYDATCTHAGCPVDYDPSSQMLVCPCHGATFDPAKAAAVVQGPADTPLSAVPFHVDGASGAITAGQ
ncbi:MAG: Rieske 2Fe-2S domain-containing protein, partial [Chloroflexota bacterium]|nr:Rieske 2Fe-2S domain-containing protein [Chloroflexota bacterium]